MRRTLAWTTVTAVMCLTVGAVDAANADRRRPSASISTPPGSVRVGAPVRAGHVTDVRGTARDDVSGVRSVHVTFCPNAQYHAGWSCGSFPVPAPIVRVRADVTCVSRARLACTWAAPVPTTPGRYVVFVSVVDRVGRTGGAPPVDVVVG